MKVGDAVSWKSQSQGSWTEKTGVIAQVLPAYHRPDATEWPSLFTGAGPGAARSHESYIVKVGTKIYWPRVSKLRQPEEKVIHVLDGPGECFDR